MLYTTLLILHLEYANCAWSPFRQMDVKKVEKMQMRTTRMVMQLHNYEDRLKFSIYLHSNTDVFKYRRLITDMIQV